MLKISGGRPPLFSQPAPEDPTEAPEESQGTMSEADYQAAPSDLLPQSMVVYMGSDKGPFECGNCCYFTDNGECQKVQGPIDPHGCCNLYCPPNHDDLGSEAPMEEPEAPEEAAAETPMDEETEDAGPAY